MKTTLFALTLLLASVAPLNSAAAQERVYDPQVAFSADQLDNLVAPIALYPDPILAQALIAATFPDQIQLAARHVRAYGTRNIDEQPWDVSVKSIAHYPPVLNLLADRDDWTTALGQAYAEQSGEVMDAVQRLRAMARAQGNLESTTQQTVIVEPRVIRIVPASPRYIYVPTYDPYYVYYQPVYFTAGYHTRYWSFGIGFPIGSWLIYDCDWRYRRVYYDGWYGDGYGWRRASRPYISINVVYVQPRYQVVYVNRTVIHREVNYVNLRRYNTVHRTVTYDNRRRGGGPGPLPRGTSGPRDDGHRDNDGRRGGDDRGGDNRGGDDRGTTDRRNVTTPPAGTIRTDPRGTSAPRVAAPEPRRTESRPVTVTPRPRSEPQSWERGSAPSPRAASPRTASAPPRVEPRSAPVTPAPSGTIYARPSAPPQSNRGGNSSVSRGSESRSTVSRPSESRPSASRPSASRPSESRGSASSAPSRSSSGPPSQSRGNSRAAVERKKN